MFILYYPKHKVFLFKYFIFQIFICYFWLIYDKVSLRLKFAWMNGEPYLCSFEWEVTLSFLVLKRDRVQRISSSFQILRKEVPRCLLLPNQLWMGLKLSLSEIEVLLLRKIDSKSS